MLTLVGLGFAFVTVGWVFGILTSLGVIFTGTAADQGQQWAAGRRPYLPIGQSD